MTFKFEWQRTTQCQGVRGFVSRGETAWDKCTKVGDTVLDVEGNVARVTFNNMYVVVVKA